MVDHIHLYQPAYQVLKQKTQPASSIRAIKGMAGNWGPFREDAPVLWDWGAHDIAMAIDLMDEPPTGIRARRKKIKTAVTGIVGESIHLNLDWPGNRIAEIFLSNILKEKQRKFTVTTEQNIFIYDDLATNKLINLEEGKTRRLALSLDPTPPLTRVLAEFIKTIRLGVTDLSDLYLAVSVVETLERFDNEIRIAESY